jgi:cbb3-type cytochrome oxidase maturation protein
MELVYLLLPMSLALGGLFLLGFLMAVKDDQFEDLETPAHRILLEEKEGET